MSTTVTHRPNPSSAMRNRVAGLLVPQRRKVVLARLGVIAILVFTWLVASAQSELVASPESTIFTLSDGLAHGWLLGPLADSLKAVMLGFIAAIAVGVPLGIALGASRTVGRIVDPLFTGLFAIPRVVLYPVLLTAVGVGFAAKWWMALLSALLPIAVNMSAGVRNTNPTLVKLGRSVGCGPVQILRFIYLPSATPAIMIGFRIGLSIAFISVIIAELFAATNGLGLVIQSAYGLQQYPRMFAAVLLVTLLAFAINLSLWSLERRLRASVD